MSDKSNTFVDDLVINTSDGKAKLLTKAAMEQLPDVPESLMPVVNTLLQRGVVAAAVPSNPGIGASCYLLDLQSICRPDKK